MKNGKHQVNKGVKTAKVQGFVEGEIVEVAVIDRKKGIYNVDGKGTFTSRVLRGILSPVKAE